MILADLHTHSGFSVDGRDSMAALCSGALAAGLDVLCVTDHYDDYSTFVPADYMASFERTRDAYAGRLDFLFGVELGEGHLSRKASGDLTGTLPFDFVLGSCHHLDGQPDFYYLEYQGESHCRSLVRRYLDELLRMIAWGGFDVLGHLTYPARYMEERGYDNIAFPEEETREVLRGLVERGLGLEVNLSGLRRGQDASPNLQLLKLYRACGGEIVTVGSDAHTAAHVGAGIAEGYELLSAAGFSHVALYHARKPEFVRIG